jgi:hypothetical protein
MAAPLTFTIEDNLDVPIARSVLRRTITQKRWKPTFVARAAAVLTAMAEILLFSEEGGVLEADFIDDPVAPGIVFACSLSWIDGKQVWVDQARSRLARVSDDLEIVKQGDHPRIYARLWLSKGDR